MDGDCGPTRILHLIETGGPGGAETVLYSLARALPRDRWVSRVVVPEIDWLHRQLQAAGLDVAVISSHGSADLRLLWRLTQEIRRFRPALIHAHLLASGVYGTLGAALSGGIPLVLTFHGTPDVDPDDRLLAWKARILRRPRNRIAYVSEDLRRRLEPLLGLPSSLGRVIHNGVEFVDRPKLETQREEMGVARDAFLVGAVGNLREAKDYSNLIKGAEIARKSRPDLSFVVLGGGPEEIRRPLLDLRDERGLAGRFEFLGFRDDAVRLMGAFDLYVSSSSSEGLPLATLEAMGMGLPVVLTACGGPAEIVSHGTTGLLVPPRDPEALAAGIVELASDQDEARRLGECGRIDVRSRFSISAMVDGYSALYNELIDGEAGPDP